MKLLFVGDDGQHLGTMEMEGEGVTITKFKKEFDPKIVNDPSQDDNDESEGIKGDIKPDGIESGVDGDGKMSKMFAMKGGKPTDGADHEEEEPPEYENEEEAAMKAKKPMKYKKPVGMF